MDIFVYGGCVSRDTLNYLDKSDYVLNAYYARSSYASAFSNIKVEDHWSGNLNSNFQKRMVRADLEKELSDSLKLAKFDILLLDFNSERMPLFAFDNGAFCTYSSEIASAQFNPSKLSGRLIQPFTKEMFDLWEKGWNKFIELIDVFHGREKIVVNKSLWSHYVDDGSSFNKFFTEDYINDANDYFIRIYDRVSMDLELNQFISVSDHNLVSSNNHQWGKSPFHYIDDAYIELGDKIKKIFFNTIKKQNPKKVAHDLRNWGEVNKLSIEGVGSKGLVDGVNKIFFGDGNEIDVFVNLSGLMDKVANPSRKKKLLVSFSGAVSNRSGKKGPFFSGVNISRELTLPLVAISDPTLDLCEELPLAWYVGNENFPNCMGSISQLIDIIAEKYDVEIVVFGGSGGGFAALSSIQKIRTKCTCLVWNPQTSITQYAETFVKQFIDVAFPGSTLTPSQEKGDNGDVVKILDKFDIVHDVQNVTLKDNISLIYLQNQSDWHTSKHAIPFLKNKTPLRVGDCIFSSKDGKCISYFGDWGVGHIAPDKNVLKALLSDIVLGESMNELKNKFNNCFYFKDQPAYCNNFYLSDDGWNVFASLNDSVVKCKIDVFDIGFNKCKFAFYLLVDGVKHEVRGYDYSNVADMTPPINYKTLDVVGYILDCYGNRLLKKIRLI